MKKRLIILFAAFAAFASCRKEPGPGGKAHIHGHLYYNNNMMSNGTVSIWYGVSNVDNCSSGYDKQITCNSHGEFEFHDMRKGKYFLYGACMDGAGTLRSGKLQVEVKSKSEMVQADIILQ